MSPLKDQKESQSANGREEAEMFQERATYTTQGEDKDGKAQTDNAYAKACSGQTERDMPVDERKRPVQ